MSENVTGLDQLAALNATLDEYARKNHRLTTGEVLEKKGRDLTIKIFRGFWELRQRASKAQRDPNGYVFSGPMFRLAKARNWATKIRTRELKGVFAELYESGQAAKILRGGKSFLPAIGKHRALSKPALLIAQELATRQRGVGLLGVSFLQRRWRHRAAVKGGSYLSRNHSRKLGELSRVEQVLTERGGYFRLTNETPGVQITDDAHAIFRRAMAEAQADMLIYLVRKQSEAINNNLKKATK